VYEEDDWSAPDDDLPDIHPDQTEIPPDGPYLRGSVGTCYWCPEPATYARLDIGLPKLKGSPRTLVSACAVHYESVVKRSLDERDAVREERRKEGLRARRGQ
jgi:hypothetical protein